MRTRDGHIARELVKLFGADAMLIADRPTCIAELVKLRGQWRAPGMQVAGNYRSSLRRGTIGSPVADVLLFELGFRGGRYHRWLLHAHASPRFADHIRASLERLQAHSSTLWLCHPFAALMTKWWTGRVVVDAFDNFAVHPEVPEDVRAELLGAYGLLAERAERIAVNSLAMQEWMLSKFGRETRVVSNAVDPALFALAEPMPLRVPGPVIGYAGKLGTRIDVELLKKLADAVSSGTIVVAGQTLNADWMRPARGHPRILFLGDRHYSKLPSFLASCAVCIVPHRVGAGENHGDATKIYEYLAAGRPVVTTAIEGTSRFAGRVTIASSREQFIEATLAAASGKHVPRGNLRDDETWSARAKELCDYFGVVSSRDSAPAAGSSTASATPRINQ